MVSRVYPKALTEALTGALDLTSGISALLVSNAYTFDRAHDFVNDVVANELTGAGRVSLTGNTVTDNGTNAVVFDANDIVFSTVDAAQTVEACIIYEDGATDADRALLFFLDGTNITTNGTDVSVAFSVNGIYSASY